MLRLFIAALVFLATPLAFAQQKGDAKAAHDRKIAMCIGCHGIPGYKTAFPSVYHVPKIAGQQPAYIISALKAYKSGERSHGTMHSQATSMNEQDMADVAVFLAGPEVLTASKNDVPADKRPKASEVCLACHGTNGVGITADYPTISGQHRDYIERALLDYQRGGRKNAVMAGMAATLTKQDIEQLAAYYSSQKPALKVVPKKTSFLSSN